MHSVRKILSHQNVEIQFPADFALNQYLHSICVYCRFSFNYSFNAFLCKYNTVCENVYDAKCAIQCKLIEITSITFYNLEQSVVLFCRCLRHLSLLELVNLNYQIFRYLLFTVLHTLENCLW